ncbi:lyase [Novosphingobium sp. G106]|uniref:lyase n=1 Tax=Novosphingobium sp. G106 TaxID=2849500 RepID=UPI001C2D53CF|nr:lyase [Novosphingobium sp. G106]MBV1687609.1 lyase [Novosphingobium sp. G106]
MQAGYEPSSPFLVQVLNGEVPLVGSEFAAENLRRVISFVADEDNANRDWAALIIGDLDLDTPAIRAALIAGAEDPVERVRAEAIRGLAHKDRGLALPFVQRALTRSRVMANIFEAAAIVAHPSLVEPLKRFALRSENDGVDALLAEAIAACEGDQ